jgi:hypothetical protein
VRDWDTATRQHHTKHFPMSFRRNKRVHREPSSGSRFEDEYPQDFVDDLTIAAQYAQAVAAVPPRQVLPIPPPSSTSTDDPHCDLTKEGMDDENEIELDVDATPSDGIHLPNTAAANVFDGERTMADSDGVARTPETFVDTQAICAMDGLDRSNGDNEEEEDDDAESDVDLADQLARMVDGEGDEMDDDLDGAANNTVILSAGGGSGSSANIKKPMTANEIDLYRLQLNDVPETIATDPSPLATEEKLALVVSPILSSETSSKLSLAGTIQHYMVDERTVVVLSHLGGVLLSEGTLLVLQTADAKDSGLALQSPTIVPIGKILEVFGPVSQPLYSIVIPAPIRSTVTKPSTRTTDSGNGSENTTLPSLQVDSKDDEAKAPDAKVDDAKESTTGNLPSSHVDTKDDEAKTADSKVDEATESAADNLLISQADSKDDEAKQDDMTAAVGVASTVVKDERKTIAAGVSPTDPWSKRGQYSILLKSNPKLPVYFLQDSMATNVLDTATVYRYSGRGCDASNIFDEEIIDGQDYSDDEQERMAKGQQQRNRKASRGGDGSGNPSNVRPQSRHGPDRSQNMGARSGHFHPRNDAPIMPQSSAQPLGSTPYSLIPHQYPPTQAMYPQGFHSGASQYLSHVHSAPLPSTGPVVPLIQQQVPFQQQQQYPFVSAQPWASGSYPHGSYSNPPPPPPPPPPRPQPPPEEDTVYYDF